MFYRPEKEREEMPSDDIARLYDFVASTTIRSAEVDAEFNQLISTINNKVGRATTETISGNKTFSGTNTHSGTNAFSGGNTFSGDLNVTGEMNIARSADISSPTAGDLWYNSTTHKLKFRKNSTTTEITTPSPGFASGPKVVSGRRYSNPFVEGTGTLVVSANVLYFYPVIVPAWAYVKIGVDISSGAGNARLGLYNESASEPTSNIIDGSTVSVASSGYKSVTITSTDITVLIFADIVFDNTPTVLTPNSSSVFPLFGSTGFSSSSNAVGGYTMAHTYGALPANASSLTAVAFNAVPLLQVEAA